MDTSERITYSFLILSIIIFSLLTLFVHLTGISYADDGYMLHSASRILHGQIPYKDFDFVYTPISLYLLSGFMALCGESIFISRMLAFLLTVVTVLLLIVITKKLSLTILQSFFVIVLYIVWGPMHINFIWPTMVAISFGFAVCLLLLSYRKVPQSIFIAGIGTVIVFLTKQNFGIAMLIPSIVFIVYNKKVHKIVLFRKYIAGIFLSGSLFFIYLITTHSLIPFLSNIYTETLVRILIKNDITTPLHVTEISPGGVLKVTFYLLPFIISIICGYMAYKRNKNLVHIPLTVMLFYILGIRPTTDIIHLAPLIGMSCLPLGMLFIFLREKWQQTGLTILLFLLIMVGFYSTFFKGYYKWGSPLITQNTYLTLPKGGIWVDERTSQTLSSIRENVAGERLYISKYYPLFYFITDTINPTRHDVVSASSFYTQYESQLRDDIDRNEITYILTQEDFKNDHIASYLSSHYVFKKKIDDFILWQRLSMRMKKKV